MAISLRSSHSTCLACMAAAKLTVVSLPLASSDIFSSGIRSENMNPHSSQAS